MMYCEVLLTLLSAGFYYGYQKAWQGDFCNLTFEKPNCFKCSVYWSAVKRQIEEFYRHFMDD